jgi:hypothetical protein
VVTGEEYQSHEDNSLNVGGKLFIKDVEEMVLATGATGTEFTLVQNLGNLGDVDLVTEGPTAGDYLCYDGTTWIPSPILGPVDAGLFSSAVIPVDLSLGSISVSVPSSLINDNKGVIIYDSISGTPGSPTNLQVQFPDSAATYISTLGLSPTNNFYKCVIAVVGNLVGENIVVVTTGAGAGVTVNGNPFGSPIATERIVYIRYIGPSSITVTGHRSN